MRWDAKLLKNIHGPRARRYIQHLAGARNRKL